MAKRATATRVRIRAMIRRRVKAVATLRDKDRARICRAETKKPHTGPQATGPRDPPPGDNPQVGTLGTPGTPLPTSKAGVAPQATRTAVVSRARASHSPLDPRQPSDSCWCTAKSGLSHTFMSCWSSSTSIRWPGQAARSGHCWLLGWPLQLSRAGLPFRMS